MSRCEIMAGDCREVMAGMEPDSVDAIVCDPPYGLEFMGKEWDRLNPYERGNPQMNQPPKPKKSESNWTVTYGTPKRIPRCRKCGKQKYNHPKSRCLCTDPEWDLEGYHHNYGMQRWHEAWAREAYRVLKPGGHLLAFGGSRTYHRMACAVEDAGFEIRDQIQWIYASGFPKSLDVGKAMDKVKDRNLLARLNDEIRRARVEAGCSLVDLGIRMQEATGGQYGKWYHRGGHMFFETGMSLPSRPEWDELRRVLPISSEFEGVYDEAEREKIGEKIHARSGGQDWPKRPGSVATPRVGDVTAPATDLARQWEGWGTALKPAHEPIVVARKPLIGTVAANVEKHGTGALNIDACRIGTELIQASGSTGMDARRFAHGTRPHDYGASINSSEHVGRWPANVVLDEEAGAMLDAQSGERGSTGGANKAGGCEFFHGGDARDTAVWRANDFGGASRFFYCAKASRAEREMGLGDVDPRPRKSHTTSGNGSGEYRTIGRASSIEKQPLAMSRNTHPTVKPVDLMRWLVRLVTPPGGLVLDPFAGSGSTGVACSVEGFDFVGIELDPEYVAIARARITEAPLSLFAPIGGTA